MSVEEPVYDPEQDAEAVRETRRGYHRTSAVWENIDGDAHIEKQKDISTDLVVQTLAEANKLFDTVHQINEATNDSSLLLQISEIGAAKARAMKSGTGAFDTDDFIARLITYMGGRRHAAHVQNEDDDDSEFDAGDAPLDWEKLGRKALAKSRRAPAMDFMLGPLSIEQKKRAAGKRAKLEKNKNDMKKPQEIREEDITRSANETTANVAMVERILAELEGDNHNVFKVIINPHDFGQSVENLFYLSFLIRDGKCAYFEDEETGEPVIMLCEPPTAKDYAEKLTKHQLVMELDMKVWKRAIEVFNITEPIIPQRPKAQMRIGDKWYG
ncbi:Nse4 C-terminal-domain-containing protein [Epithele typhae]|uniref:Nse4 C-terminal-domain-containing protein n=1 Tax=Epithele typhae TaxID=378194 RepID=UPI002007447E|nr:Nse4 C-terminal-domain-containing protein [Epithele typhae]KAH9939785.1 Nse4 C-terminal-domain-containing protein [Epithele typhae]